MAEIVKVYREPVPALRFIGKKYPGFTPWGEWFMNGWFDLLESAMGGVDAIAALWPDGTGYIGLERRKDGEPFEYWIGMFTPSGTPVPDGFEALDFPETSLGVCWIYGEEGETHGAVGGCADALEKAGFSILKLSGEPKADPEKEERVWVQREDGDGAVWSFENCQCPRYTTPDEHGKVILDYVYFVK